jgi:hypothetical protein
MPKRQTDRREGDVIGRLVPGELLDTDAVYRCCGCGEVKLMELRRAGVLEPKKKFGRLWYRSEDLIRVIESEG